MESLSHEYESIQHDKEYNEYLKDCAEYDQEILNETEPDDDSIEVKKQHAKITSQFY